MYKFLKSILRKLISGKFLFENELIFRKLLSLFYLGNKFECNICHKKHRKFIQRGDNDFICPNCGSIGRNRSFWQLLTSDNFDLQLITPDNINSKIKPRILDFSPSRSIFRKFKSIKEVEYIATDLSNNFLSDFSYNILDLSEIRNSFDLIICYHILEHIEEDRKAISELYKSLKNNGFCLIQAPFKNGEIYEDFNIKSEEDRKIHFGQEDHVRIYSAVGLKSRLQEAGFEVEINSSTNNKYNYHLFPENDVILICKKN